MNTQKESFLIKGVRQAINYALDKQAFVDTIIEGRGLVANSYINAAIQDGPMKWKLIRMIRKKRKNC